MTSKETIEELHTIIDNIANKLTTVTYLEIQHSLDEVKEDLQKLDYYEKIKLMLKQKGCVLKYIESEDCFAVRCILDENWHKLSKDLVENNIKEEVKPMSLIVKVKKQDKILEILKPYFSGAVFPSAINFNFSEGEWKSIKEWLDNGN